MATQLVDGFGRVHRDLRISVTDRCNFRCTYCMPAEGLDWMARDDLLTFEEIARVARIMGRASRHRQHPTNRRRADGARPTWRLSWRCWLGSAPIWR